jgi:Polyketide cyclase / dehydrase and lipid transport
MKTRFGAERSIDAPAAVVYHCLADYREHHRPSGFLPPAFEQLDIARGGVGAGTEYRLIMAVGGRRRAVTTSVSEPVPGHKLVETGSGIETTFTVEQTVDGAQVRFDTVLDEGGLQGILNRLFAARIFGPIYEDELRRLEDHAKAHPIHLSRAPGRSADKPAALDAATVPFC